MLTLPMVCPQYLCKINPSNGSVTNKYYYTNAQILRQDNSSGSYYYVHDRLGSVRLMTDGFGLVRNSYTYSPFGEDFSTECTEAVYNPFKFTGQWYDDEFGQYYLRARMYDPQIMRFTARDPVRGKFVRPLTLHLYLYCLNDPMNGIDPTGKFSAWSIFGGLSAGATVHSAAIYTVATGIQFDNERLIQIGLQMEHFVAPAVYFGAAIGPVLPKVPGALTKAAVATWEMATSAAVYTSGYIYAGAEALTYWAMANPYEFVSIIDVIGQFGGPPGSTPTTPAGWVAWLYTNSKNSQD
jgi:RHS repeat-associated protein